MCNDFGVLPKDCSKFLQQQLHSIVLLQYIESFKIFELMQSYSGDCFGVSSIQSLERSCRSEGI